jgi:hypothetical protein
MMDSFPIGGAKAGAKCKAYLEEQVVRQDVGEGAHHIGVMLDLVEAGLDLIGMDDTVVVEI